MHSFRNSNPTPLTVVLPLGISIALALLGDLALFASLPVNVNVVGISVANLGVIFGLHRLIRIPGNTIGGFLVNASHRRPFFVLGMTLAVLSTLGYAMAHTLFFLILTRLCWGIAWIFLYISSMAMLIDVTDVDNRGKWMGVYNTWYLVGIALGSVLGGVLADRIGFRHSMLVCAFFSFLGWLTALLFLPETCTLSGNHSPQNSTYGAVTKKIQGLWKLVRQISDLWVVLILYMVNQFAAEGVALSVLSLLLKTRFSDGVIVGGMLIGISSLSGFLLAVRYLLSAAISPIAGHLSDRHSNGRSILLVLGIGLNIISFIMIGWSARLVIISAGLVLNAVGGGCLLVGLSSTLGDITPKNAEGDVVGLYATAGDIGSALGPILAFVLLESFKVPVIFYICAFLFACCLGLVMVKRKMNVDRSEVTHYNSNNGIYQ